MTIALTRTYIGIGSNLEEPTNNVLQAFTELESIGQVTARSNLYKTKPWGFTEQPDFINAVAALDVDCSPQQLLQSLLQIEQKMGRERLIKWGPRIIDLDILLFGDQKISQTSLTIPHPHMYERAFVLVPLAELNPDFSAAVSSLPADALAEISLMNTTDMPAPIN